MNSVSRPRSSWTVAVAGLLAVLGMCAIVVSAAAAGRGASGSNAAPIRLVHTLEPEQTGIGSPVGIAFSAPGRAFEVVGRPPAQTAPSVADVVKLKPFERLAGSARAGSTRLATLGDPVNMAYDLRRGRLLLLGNARELLEVKVQPDGDLAPATLVRRDAGGFRLRDPQGIAVDPTDGAVFILDAGGQRIVRVEPKADGSLAGAKTTEIDLRPSGLTHLRGLALDPATGHLQLRGGDTLYELTAAGEVVATRDLSGLELASPEGMVFAPSSDETDDPGELSLFVADSGGGPSQSSGQIAELSLTALPAAGPSSFTPSLVNTVDLAAVSPPSPDSSGIAYLPARNTLLMVDGEVEEKVSGITHFQGVNLWELSLSGTVVRTTNISKVAPVVLPVTNEPTDIAVNPANGHCFVSDDGGKRVYELTPGGDGLCGTADDTFTSFSTSGSGNNDAEGVAYSTFNGHLFVADGVNREIYEYTTSGALVSHFDTLQYGVEDPEGVEVNSATGTIFVLSNRKSGPLVIETTTGGGLLQTLNVAAAPLKKPAGIAYAPASNGSGVKRFYIVDRGIDNNSDPHIIDGKMFELTAPQSGGGGNQPPSVSAGPDQAVTLPASATLNGTVSDDGLPTPPSLTTTWSKRSGPGTVTFGNASAVDTTAAFSVAGTYVLRLTANDGQLSAFDELTVTVNPAGGGNQPPSVNAGSDQAVTLPASATLDGTVSDDGLPTPPSLTTTWSKQSGPGTVTFGNASAVDTTAGFSAAGTYVLRLTANDGQLSAFDELTVTVSPAGGGGQVLEVRVAATADDAEEVAGSGSMQRNSGDLNMMSDTSDTKQVVGLRFLGVAIPKGATITSAYVQFAAHKVNSEATSLTVRGQAADNPGTFLSANFNLSSRPTTAAGAAWSPPAWLTVGAVGPAQRTSSIAAVVQEIVNRAGWSSGNSIVILVTGSGKRLATSYNNNPGLAALLHIEWT